MKQIQPVVYGYVCVEYNNIPMQPGYLRSKSEMQEEACNDFEAFGVKSKFKPSYYPTVEQYKEAHYETIQNATN